MTNRSNNNYVYIYEYDEGPLYIGIGVSNRPGRYARAQNVRIGHEDFFRWAVQRFGGKPPGFRVRIVATCLTRRQALLIESTLMTEYSMYFDLFNRVVSTVLVPNADELEPSLCVHAYISRRRLRYPGSPEARERLFKEKRRKANREYRDSLEGEIHKRARAEWSRITKYASLGVQIGRYKRTDPKRAAELRKKRDAIIPFKDWKKTSEGIAVVMQVTEDVHRERREQGQTGSK